MAAADSSRDPTPQQRAAITTLDRNVVVVAGAGTGKTFVLVRRFVALLEANPDWPISAVVAITFTNRAANEMRARVRAEFEFRRANAADDRSRQRWGDLLSQIEAARITTIHGLCSEIVRANAAAIGVDPGFEVLDDPQSGMLRADAVNLALAETVQPGALSLEDAALAGEVIARYGEQEIRKALNNATLLNSELNPARGFDALLEEWEAHAQNMFTSPFVPILDKCNPPANEDLIAIQARLALDNLLRFNRISTSLNERFESLRGLTSINLTGGSTKLWPEVKTAKEDLKQAREDAKFLLDRIGQPPGDQDIDVRVMLDGWRVLLTRTRAAYNRLKQLRAALDYDDLEHFAALVLSKKTAADRYVGVEFRHVMVDEFQDTNFRQWDIVRAVAPPENPGTLFIVGDPKQSIYSFRGADVTVFEAARYQIETSGGDVLFLTESFRTHAPLIDSLNTLFEKVLVSPAAALEQGVFVEFDPSQRLQSRRTGSPDGVFLAAYTVPKSTTSTDSSLLREARAVAQRINALVRNGDTWVLDSRTRQYRRPRYGDIALLLRSFKGKVDVFERAFNDEGIPYITLGGQGFYGRREVKDLLCALRALHNPADELELAAALHSPLFAISDVDLLLLRQPRHVAGENAPRPMPMIEALLAEAEDRRARNLDYDPLVFSAGVFNQLAPLVGRAPVEVLIQSLIHATGYMATLAGLPDGRQMRANVEKLVDRARETGLTALNQFVRHLNDMTEAEAKEGGVALEADNAVRLTTIHSSKGLEYPIVWIADACAESKGGSDAILNFSGELGCKLPKPDQVPLDPDKPDADKWLHPYVFRRNSALRAERDRAESLRLLYVAATRAQDALFISGVPGRESIGGWLGLIADDLTPDELHPAPVTPREHAPAEVAAPSAEPLDFPLARTLPAAPPPTRLHLSASDITMLGGHFSAPDPEQKERYTRRLRRRMLDEQSEPIELLTYDPEGGGLAARRYGTLVHDALRYGYDELLDSDRRRVETLLRAMAWELGITQPDHLEKAVGIAMSALYKYRHSALSRELAATDAIYRELPFVFQRDGHVIHGFIDLLYRSPDGRWTVVDFKTDRIPDEPDALRRHARTYCLQMAVYSEAVAAQTGQTPRAMIVFLHYPDQPVIFDPDDLRAELEQVPLRRLVEMLSEEGA